MKKEIIYIVIATNTNGVDRAFIHKSERQAKANVNFFLENGWVNANYFAVDSIMIDTIKIV